MGRKNKKSLTVQEVEKAKVLFASGLTYHAVGVELRRDPKTIKRVLSTPEVVAEVQELKAEIANLYEDLSKKILVSISDEDIKKANLRDRLISAGIATDKSQLLKGGSTQNILIGLRMFMLKALENI
jgi:hypothetical protein